jgi:3-methyladenine DNA glycosylase AlkC
MEKDYSFTKYFGKNLAEMLADKIHQIYEYFPKDKYINAIDSKCENLNYTKRIELHATELRNFLPDDYITATEILIKILGEENKNETGMFKEFYWILPIGKFVEKFGLEHFDLSIYAIEEITKRNTGEYAIRPYIRKYPDQSLAKMEIWAKSENFHLRRLASEGLRPKLPWAAKLDTFIDNPYPVFRILEILKQDERMFVKKSVANHLTDWLKVNKNPTIELIKSWNKSDNIHTKWIIKRAIRKIDIIEHLQ